MTTATESNILVIQPGQGYVLDVLVDYYSTSERDVTVRLTDKTTGVNHVDVFYKYSFGSCFVVPFKMIATFFHCTKRADDFLELWSVELVGELIKQPTLPELLNISNVKGKTLVVKLQVGEKPTDVKLKVMSLTDTELKGVDPQGKLWSVKLGFQRAYLSQVEQNGETVEELMFYKEQELTSIDGLAYNDIASVFITFAGKVIPYAVLGVSLSKGF
jgi:hypothetical protein